MSDELMQQLAEMVSGMIKPAVPMSAMLWDTAGVAEYLHRVPAVVRNKIAPLPGFPRAIRLPAEKGKAYPLYKAVEVIAWAEKHQEKR